MLDGDHYRTQELVSQLLNNAQIRQALDLIESLNPEINIVDTHNGVKTYSYNYKNIIVSYGETLYLTMMDFQRRFFSQKP